MKRILTLLMIISSTFGAFAQNSFEDMPNYRKNDIVLDPFWLIGGLALNASYERLISEDSGVGANVILGFGDGLEYFTQVSPYYRAYFGSKYASGFYIEGFLPVTINNDNYINEDRVNTSDRYTTAGGGFGLGGKWIAKKKFVFELNIGVARKIIGGSSSIDPVTGKGMIGVGFAF